jgi:RNA polymerase sigma factor (sigma-70 family)
VNVIGGSFEEFYLATRDRCLRAVLAVVGQRALAEDLVAEAMCRAWRSWATVATHPAPQAWVMRTALNLNVEWWRRRRREVPLDGHDPQVAVGRDEVDPWWMDALRRLPERQRQVVAVRVLLDLDTAQTAELLGMKPATVRVHLYRAAATLRGELAAATRSEGQ